MADVEFDMGSAAPIDGEGELVPDRGMQGPRSWQDRANDWLRGRPDTLPDAMMNQIEEQRQKSEHLIGCLQLAIIAVMGLLYNVVPRSAGVSGLPSFVPFMLITYAMLAVVRMALAGQHKIGTMFEVFSIIADVGLIIGFIWTTHLQYAQPAASYLKSPAILFLYAVIALRTLTYAPWQVLFAGMAAVVGWTGLLLYAISRDGAERLMTWDYGVYGNSLAIHFGAELQKMLAIMIVAIVLAIGVARGRAILFRSLTEQYVNARMSQFLEPGLAERIMGSGVLMEPGKGRNAQCAAMFIDLKGFTAIAATLTPQEVLDLLARYHHLVVPIIRDNRGSISSFAGDGILATFGAVSDNDTYAANAIRAAEEISEVFRRWYEERVARKQTPLQLGIGIDSGPVSVGIVGEGSRLQYTVIGTAVNYAAKLQAHTRKDNVSGFTSLATYNLARMQGYQRANPREIQHKQRVRGIEEAMDLVVFP
jgi:adenylate cyclase